MGCQSLLQRVFPSQGSNPGLLHCRQILHCLSHQGARGQDWFCPLEASAELLCCHCNHLTPLRLRPPRSQTLQVPVASGASLEHPWSLLRGTQERPFHAPLVSEFCEMKHLIFKRADTMETLGQNVFTYKTHSHTSVFPLHLSHRPPLTASPRPHPVSAGLWGREPPLASAHWHRCLGVPLLCLLRVLADGRAQSGPVVWPGERATPLSCPQRDTAPMVRAGGEAERGSGCVEGTQPVGAAQRGGAL